MEGKILINQTNYYDLSVITVCKNAAALLPATIESVLWQKKHSTLRIEHIVIDGESTDETPKIGESALKKGEIEQFISESDNGIYDAMNKGISLASGTVLYFLNCGDIICKHDLKKIIAPILSNEATAVAGAIITTGDSYERKDLPTTDRLYQGVYTSHQAYFSSLILYQELGNFNTKFKCIADADFMARVTLKYGLPHFSNIAVAYSPAEGVSDNSRVKYLHEYVELRKQYWKEIVTRCKEDNKYLYFTFSRIIEDIRNLEDWLHITGSSYIDSIFELRHQTDSIGAIMPSLIRKTLLIWISSQLLPYFIKNRRLTSFQRSVIKYPKVKGFIQQLCRLLTR